MAGPRGLAFFLSSDRDKWLATFGLLLLSVPILGQMISTLMCPNIRTCTNPVRLENRRRLD